MVKENVQNIKDILSTICDPEIPVLSIIELGILKNIIQGDDSLEIVITPTYSACPAMNFFKMDIKAALEQKGYQNVSVRIDLSPPWSTDMISEEGKKKLLNYGIAPPVSKSCQSLAPEVACPRCGTTHTSVISEFGSTACKALYKCEECLEPFDYFKCY